MWVSRLRHDQLDERIDCEYYDPAALSAIAKLRKFQPQPIRTFITDIRSEPPIHTDHYADEGIPIISPANFSDFEIDLSSTNKLSRKHKDKFSKFILEPGRLLYALVGDVGHACVVPTPAPEAISYRRTANLKLSGIDPYFVCTFLNVPVGSLQLKRLTTGVIQAQVRLEDSATILLPTLDTSIQHYIGDKVRQAERLRQISQRRSEYALQLVNAFLADKESAVNLEHTISKLLNGEVLADDRFQQNESKRARKPNQGRKSSRIPKNFLTTRLDCNFYNRDALELDMRFAKGYEVSTFGDVVDQSRQITNGVRGPDIQPSIFKLVRLQDFAGWSIDFDSCLTISEAQFRENRRCQLQEGDVIVAIGGYIGCAAMARRVQTAVIGQHSAVLPMGTNSKVDGGFLVAFLSSNAGAIQLQRYVSGTVQVGINLEDLRQIRLPLPSSVLQKHIGDAIRKADDCSHWASRLLNLACRLIEALIEGRLTENELCEAYVALNAGDHQADSSILGRMTVGGIDVPHEPPLFPDLDGLYAAIDEAERAHTDGETS